MRPHLFVRGGLWVCNLFGTRPAMGDTPKEAYRQWVYANSAGSVAV